MPKSWHCYTWEVSLYVVTLCMVRDLEKVEVFSPTPESRRRLVEEWGSRVSAEVVETASVEEAISGADPVPATTNSIFSLFSREGCSSPGFMFRALNLANWMRRHTNAPIRSSSIDRKPKPFQIAIGVDRQSIPEHGRRAGNIRSREKTGLFGISQHCAQLVNGEHPRQNEERCDELLLRRSRSWMPMSSGWQ